MVNRIVVGAHYGLRDWIAQRATAVVMAVYSVILLVTVGAIGPDSFEAWRGIFANGFMNCVDVCPKGLNPTKAIGKIKELMVKRAV